MSRHPPTHPTGYERPDQMWTAVTARIKNEDPSAVAQRQRQFLYGRFLARVFTHDPDAWVLKGGTALLARVRDTRHSKDVDLNRIVGTLEDAVQELRVATATELDDHVRFAAGTVKLSSSRPGQRGRDTARVTISPYVGVRPMNPFGVDVVVGTLITAGLDLHQPTPVGGFPGLTSPPYRLYPVVDHVADKICATMELYAGLPSTRSRDLFDLVVFACTQTIHAAPLRRAIEAERLHRGLAPILAWTAPSAWTTGYATAARGTPYGAEYPTFASGNGLVAQVLDPVLSGELASGTWDPANRRWLENHPPCR